MKYYPQKNNDGFTLIELLVSSAIFVIVVTIGISGLLQMNRTHKHTQYEKEQLDTLHAVMEDMVRNIRTSKQFRCDVNGDFGNSVVETPKNCINTSGDDKQASLKIAMEGTFGVKDSDLPPGTSDQISYWIEDDGSGTWGVYKSISGADDVGGGGAVFSLLTPSPIKIDPTKSGFSVAHAEPDGVDHDQPFVTIRLSGTIKYLNDVIPFTLQAAVAPHTPKE